MLLRVKGSPFAPTLCATDALITADGCCAQRSIGLPFLDVSVVATCPPSGAWQSPRGDSYFERVEALGVSGLLRRPSPVLTWISYNQRQRVSELAVHVEEFSGSLIGRRRSRRDGVGRVGVRTQGTGGGRRGRRRPAGGGYRLAAADGGIFDYWNSAFYGSAVPN